MSPRAIAILAAPLAAISIILLVLLLVIGIMPWWLSVLLVVVLAAVAAFVLYSRAESIVAGSVDARPTNRTDAPRFVNMVEELCARAGQSDPELLLVESESINAMAFGTSPSSSSIAITRGALRRLSVVQLEGLLAREVGRLRRGDAVIDTLAASFIRLPLRPFGNLDTRLLQQLQGDDGEARVDMATMELTRYPPGLIETYEEMQRAGDPASARGIASHLWTRRPDAESAWSLDDRIALLREL